MPSPQPLTPDDRQTLMMWTSPPLTLPVHTDLGHQLMLAVAGVESTLVLGEYGTGKTESCRRLAAAFEDAEVQRSYADPAYSPRRVIMYESATAEGRKTVLVDLCEQVGQEPLSSSARRVHTPTHLVSQIADLCHRRKVHALILDEAGKVNPHNLDLVRQVPDAAKALGHPMGILYVGPPELRAAMAETGQLGQRVSAEVHFERMTATQLHALLDGWHPHLAGVRETLGAKAWRTLVEKIMAKSRGSIRRVDRIVTNAHYFSLAMDRRIDATVIELAIDKLVDEQ